MASFLSKTKTLKPLITGNSVYGRFGFHLTRDSVIDLVRSCYSFHIAAAGETLILGHGSNPIDLLIANDIIAPELERLGLPVSVVSEPCIVGQISWLCWQSKKKCLGLHVSSSDPFRGDVSLRFFDQSGLPFSPADLLRILRSPCNVRTLTPIALEKSIIELVNLDGYSSYLTSLGFKPSTSTLYCDVMFGAAESALAAANNAGINTKVFNRGTDNPRLINYSPSPTGASLKWIADSLTIGPSDVFAAIDFDGDSIGIYDARQKVELNPSSVTLLLLKHLAEKVGSNHTVVLSAGLNQYTVRYAKKLGFKVKTTTKGLDALRSLVAVGEPPLLYADEGGHYFSQEKGCCPNPIISALLILELCQAKGMSPGEIVDIIFEKSLKKKYSIQKVVIQRLESRDRFESLLAAEEVITDWKEGLVSIFRTEQKDRLVVRDMSDRSGIEVTIESTSETRTKALTDLTSLIGQRCYETSFN